MQKKYMLSSLVFLLMIPTFSNASAYDLGGASQRADIKWLKISNSLPLPSRNI